MNERKKERKEKRKKNKLKCFVNWDKKEKENEWWQEGKNDVKLLSSNKGVINLKIWIEMNAFFHFF